MIDNSTAMLTMLVISSDAEVLRSLWSIGDSSRCKLEVASSAWQAMDKVQAGSDLDLLLLDALREEGDGLPILRWLRRLRPALPILVIGPADVAGKKEESIRMGARDYLDWPMPPDELEAAIQRNLLRTTESAEAEMTSDDVEVISSDCCFVSITPAMRKLRVQAGLLAEADVPVLLLGEQGSGKQTVARLIHKLSVRSGFPFAKMNCAALPADLLEKELLGREEGGVDKPIRAKPGKVESCANGTILVDHITEMPLSMQANLLEILKHKRFTKRGSASAIEANIRILAAGPRDMERALSEKRLREDLYQQLNKYTIHIPPLRERKSELTLIARHFMHRMAKRYGLVPREFSPAILDVWQAHSWPGNLRELEHSVKRYLMVGDSDLSFQQSRLEAIDGLQSPGISVTGTKNQISSSSGQFRASSLGTTSLRSIVQSVKSEAEKNAIGLALQRTGWNRKAAARLLKVSYRTVLHKIDEYQLTSTDYPGAQRAHMGDDAEASVIEQKQSNGNSPVVESHQNRRQELL